MIDIDTIGIGQLLCMNFLLFRQNEKGLVLVKSCFLIAPDQFGLLAIHALPFNLLEVSPEIDGGNSDFDLLLLYSALGGDVCQLHFESFLLSADRV